MSEKYCIKWRSLSTDAFGYGEGDFTKEEAESIAEGLNKGESGELVRHEAILSGERDNLLPVLTENYR